MNPMTKRAGVAVALIALALIPSTVKIGSFFFDTLFEGPVARNVLALQDRAFPGAMDDLRAWADSPLAHVLAARERDAGPALNRKLEWRGEVQGFELEPLLTPDGAALMAACEQFPACGPEAFSALGLATNAFDVFSQAMEFDHWSVNVSSPVEALAKSGRIAVDSRKPTADFRRLRGLGRAYLLTAMHAKDPSLLLTPLSQVTHMGELLMTQQTSEGAISGVAMLADARDALTAFEASRAAKPAAEAALDLLASVLPPVEDVRRFERLAQVIPLFFVPLTDADRLGVLLAADKAGAFVCEGAARQFSPEAAALLVYAEPTVAGEVDYRPYVAVAETLLSPLSPCQMPFERETWTHREDLKIADLGGLHGLPWLRRSYFLLRATTSAAEAAAPMPAPPAEQEGAPGTPSEN